MLQDTINKKGSSLFNSRVLLFLISQNLSLFGSSVVGFAIIWHITLETSSGTWLMLGTLTTMIPPGVGFALGRGLGGLIQP